MEPLQKAMNMLDDNIFKLWFYFYAKPCDGSFILSPQNICNSLGITLNEYNSAFSELEKIGFLEATETGYTFHESIARG